MGSGRASNKYQYKVLKDAYMLRGRHRATEKERDIYREIEAGRQRKTRTTRDRETEKKNRWTKTYRQMHKE